MPFTPNCSAIDMTTLPPNECPINACIPQRQKDAQGRMQANMPPAEKVINSCC